MEKIKEKYKITIMALIGMTVLIAVIFYILGSASLELGDIILVIIPIILVIGVMIIALIYALQRGVMLLPCGLGYTRHLQACREPFHELVDRMIVFLIFLELFPP